TGLWARERARPGPGRSGGGGGCRPLHVRLRDPLSHPSGAEEVVPPLDLVRVVREVAVRRGVVADELREAPPVADRALLDVAELAGDAGQVALRPCAAVPERVLVGLERDAAGGVVGALR